VAKDKAYAKLTIPDLRLGHYQQNPCCPWNRENTDFVERL